MIYNYILEMKTVVYDVLFDFSDPVQGKGAMDGHYSLYLLGLLSGQYINISVRCLET